MEPANLIFISVVFLGGIVSAAAFVVGFKSA